MSESRSWMSQLKKGEGICSSSALVGPSADWLMHTSVGEGRLYCPRTRMLNNLLPSQMLEV